MTKPCKPLLYDYFKPVKVFLSWYILQHLFNCKFFKAVGSCYFSFTRWFFNESDNITWLSPDKEDMKLLLVYLPYPNACNSLAKRSLESVAQFKGIRADFDDIIQQGTESGQRKGGWEQGDVAKLYTHLQVVIKGVFILEDISMWLLSDFSFKCHQEQ